ncbi:hypothetical protein [Pseudarthrobacter sulfonivorans]|uniref:hypothetical protein n=1 Tax=Pseudarthrobacter sulfonivorans TaxID=121292 RepID=UPI0028562595|nr:hypothetical protein [Pseudarthrobacter sulfonivorans]MDR6415460.1 hypothetical protein [Pseudarthrobacter sulfonivorans]
MAKFRSPWRLLRPLLLAGAVTATWLTLSSSAATADSSTESGSLLGGVTSSVSTLSAPLTGAVSPLLEPKSPAAPAAKPAGLLLPAVSNLASTADQFVAAVPVVKSVVPSGAVSAVAVPVAAATDGTVAGLVDVAVPPLVTAVPIIEPVVQPVTDLVTGETPLPAALPGVLDPSVDLPAALGSDPALASDPTAVGASTEVAAPAALEKTGTVAHAAADAPWTSLASTGLSAAGIPSASLHPATLETPLAEGPSPSPLPAQAPGSGAGSGASSSGPSGAVAWLNDFDLDLPLSGTFSISGAFKHAPSPVSFDPGSSPD